MVLRSPILSPVRSPMRSIAGTAAGEPEPVVVAPSITSPSDAATDIGETPTITTSAFAVTNEGSDTHASTDWQVASDSDFSTIVVQSADDATNKTSWTVPSGNLSASTTYYVRARHTGTMYGDSGWSSTVSFTTAASFFDTYGSALAAYAIGNDLSLVETSGGSPGTVGQSMVALTNLASGSDFGDAAAVLTAPRLRTANGYYYWERATGSSGGMRGNRPGGGTDHTSVDVFLVIRKAAANTSGNFSEAPGVSVTYLDGNAGVSSSIISTAVGLELDGVTVTNTKDALHDALDAAQEFKVLRLVDGDFGQEGYFGAGTGADNDYIAAMLLYDHAVAEANLATIMSDLTALADALNGA